MTTVLRSPQPLFLRVSEVAALLDVDPRTVHRAIDEDGLPAVRLGRAIRIPTQAFLDWAHLTPNDSEAGASTAPATAHDCPSDASGRTPHEHGHPDTPTPASSHLRAVDGT